MIGYSEMLELVCISAYNLYRSTLIGNAPPLTQALADELNNPAIGDLVIETSTIWKRDRDEHRFGKLLRIEHAPIHSAKDWARDGETGPIPCEIVYVIEPLRLQGIGEYRWTNASFIKVKTDLISYLRPEEKTHARTVVEIRGEEATKI